MYLAMFKLGQISFSKRNVEAETMLVLCVQLHTTLHLLNSSYMNGALWNLNGFMSC